MRLGPRGSRALTGFVALLLTAPIVGLAQQEQPPFVADEAGPAISTPGPTLPMAPLILGAPSAGFSDLEARVAELEAARNKAADQEAVAKAEARSKPTANFVGVIDFDTVAFTQDENSKIQFPPGADVRNAVGFRRARIGATGDAFDVCDYRIEMDFAPFVNVRNAADTSSLIIPETALKSTWIGLKDVPYLGSVRVGHIKEPFSLDDLTRDRYGTFMERSLVDEAAFVPGRSPGIQAGNYMLDERMTWRFGIYVPDVSENPPIFLGRRGGVAYTGRLTLLPWYDEEADGSRYLHTGIAYSYRQNATGALLYAARPETFFGPVTITTEGQLTGANGDVDHNQLLGTEFALTNGPLTIQGEYYDSFVDRTLHPDVQFSGYYAYVSYFLTGEYKPYNRKTATFDRLIPKHNFMYFREGEHTFAKGWALGRSAIATPSSTSMTAWCRAATPPHTRWNLIGI